MFTLRPVHELSEVVVLIKDDGPYFYDSDDAAEAAKGEGDGK